MKRRVVMNTQKSVCKGKILRPCSKHNTKSATKLGRSCTHIPTVRCHEEVMSKLSRYNNTDDCFCEPVSSSDKTQKHKKTTTKHGIKKDDKVKSVYLKSTNMYETVSAPINKGQKDSFPKTRSKSIPLIQQPNLEDSVDVVPVKLSSNNDYNRRSRNVLKQKESVTSVSKRKSSETCRATWDKLLKSESQKLTQNNTAKDRILSSEKSSDNHLQSDESLPDTPKKKVSINVSNKTCEKDKKESDQLYKIVGFPKASKSSFEQFNFTDPVKTLDFLIKQLREKLLKQPENENLQQIIVDMENALLHICVENHVYSKDMPEENGYNTEDGSSANIAPKSGVTNGSDTKGINSHLDIAQLQKGLQESCLFLQSLCIKQREKCTNHTREKEQLTLQLAESRRLLAIAKSREKDYEVTIGELRLKIQESSTRKDYQYRSLQELTDTVSKLRAENETLGPFKEAVKRLNAKLKETASEKEILISKLHLKELEIEKLKVLLEVKENLNPVSKHKNDEKYKEYIEQEAKLKMSNEDKDNSSLSSTITSWTGDKPGLVCSSQASSSPRHSPSPYNSWQHISSIYQQPSGALNLNKDIADIFQTLKRKTAENEPPKLELELPSSNSSSWGDKEDINTKLVFSDGESGTQSS